MKNSEMVKKCLTCDHRVKTTTTGIYMKGRCPKCGFDHQNEYEVQGLMFLKTHDTEFKAEFVKFDYHFAGDKEKRDIYNITLSRNGVDCTLRFGQAISSSGKFHFYHNGVFKKCAEEKDPKTAVYHYTKSDPTGWKLNRRKKPTPYDILTCLQKHNPGTFDEFCSDFGYDNDSIKANNTYKAVVEEYLQLSRMFTESELKLMAEIN